MSYSPRRILLCAYACRPNAGSEPMVGWSAYQALRKQHAVRVLCSDSGAAAIAEAVTAGEADAEDFCWIPERFRGTGRPAVDKLLSWLNTFHFQRTLLEQGRREIQAFRPDVIHQVTIATWRVENPLAGRGIPFVWGPVGGGEELPLTFLRTFSAFSASFEVARMISGLMARHHPAVKQTARQADWIFAGNRPTADLLARLRGSSAGVEILPQVFFAEKKMQEFQPRVEKKEVPPASVQIFSGGYVEARKGMSLALQALARLKQRGYSFHYEHGGIGPERTHLIRQIEKMGLTKEAKIVQPYSGEAYQQKLRTTDVFLFPSLRESCGISLLEAMGHGCVPVVADHAGPGEIVTPECGVKIPVTRPKEFVARLSDELASLFQDAEKRRRLGAAARSRVLKKFSQSHWLERVENAYHLTTPRAG